jgi:uncharacterized DUF497 family protein
MIKWSEQKDRWLRENRGVSFQEISAAVLSGSLIEIMENPARRGQMAFVIRLHGYVWVVPFVTEGDTIFLKTAYPSRKMHKRYGGTDEEQEQA